MKTGCLTIVREWPAVALALRARAAAEDSRSRMMSSATSANTMSAA